MAVLYFPFKSHLQHVCTPVSMYEYMWIYAGMQIVFYRVWEGEREKNPKWSPPANPSLFFILFFINKYIFI